MNEPLELFKTLADKSRLDILKTLSEGEIYTELLAERLGLSQATVSFHMKKLEEAGLVSRRKEQYYTIYTLNREALECRVGDLVMASGTDAEQAEREEKYRQKVIETFFEDGRLKSIPVQHKKRLICLREIAGRFEKGRVYQEKEFSDILAGINGDYCTLRRDMIGEGLVRRNKSEYIRIV